MKTTKNKELSVAWNKRLKLHAEAIKLWKKGDKLNAEREKLYAESNKLCVEGDRLCVEANKFWIEGDKLWIETVQKAYGNIKVKWMIDDVCYLENGEIFRP